MAGSMVKIRSKYGYIRIFLYGSKFENTAKKRVFNFELLTAVQFSENV